MTATSTPVRPAVPRAAVPGLALALSAAFSFGTSGPAAKAVIDAGLTPLDTVWLRLAGAAVLLVPLALAIRGPALRTLVRRHRALLVGYGLLSIAGVQVCYFFAVSRLPVGIALLLEYLAPALVIGWLVLVRRTRLPREAFAGALLAVCGIAVVVQVWSGLQLDLLGLLAGIGSAACQASFFVLSDRLAGEGDALALAAGGMAVGAVVLGLVAQPWQLPWSTLLGEASVAGTVLPVLVLVGWIVVVSTVLAYTTGIGAVRLLSAPVAGVIATVEVVIAALVAWLVLGERLSPVQLLGGVIVLCGALLAQRAASQPVPPPSPIPGPAVQEAHR
ncbi:EamA family transporter [Plantactinospora sp. ZYX-F-223]|uniref:EamA family transporter n=1 Tax=Plantactinospora sp. ZYX-F-223 TaxID=3144103 RepID=UPI0031FDEF09